MKILVTGNLGYVGTILTNIFIENNYSIIGYDIGYFKDCLISKNYKNPNEQIFSDIRKFDEKILKDIDCVVHLASLSNDPLGQLEPKITREVNYKAAVEIAELSKLNNVSKFIYLSTQSLYGISNTNEDLDEYDSKKNPITEYAISKYKAEKEIIQLNSEKFRTISLRPATVFGFSPRFRSDIVYNNLISSAYLEKQILIKSDGKPIRPVVDIQDLCKIIISIIDNNYSGEVFGRCFNVGYPGCNYTVSQLAEFASKVVDGSKIVYSKDPPKDERTYSVSFKRLEQSFKNTNLKVDLEKSGLEMIKHFDKINFEEKFKQKELTVRLEKLKNLISEKKVNKNLDLV
jgi:nucleoside-diphosphate-sugar epimerase